MAAFPCFSPALPASVSYLCDSGITRWKVVMSVAIGMCAWREMLVGFLGDLDQVAWVHGAENRVGPRHLKHYVTFIALP